jgi:hypothetical protein
MVDFMPWSPLPPGKNPGMPWIEGYSCSRVGLDVLLKRKISFPSPNSNPRLSWPVTSYVYHDTQIPCDWESGLLIRMLYLTHTHTHTHTHTRTHARARALYMYITGHAVRPFPWSFHCSCHLLPNCNTFWYGMQYSYTLYRWVYKYCWHIICDNCSQIEVNWRFRGSCHITWIFYKHCNDCAALIKLLEFLLDFFVFF